MAHVCQLHRRRKIWKTIVSNLSMLKFYNETVKPEEGRQDHLSAFVMRIKLLNAAYL